MYMKKTHHLHLYHPDRPDGSKIKLNPASRPQ